MTVSEDKGQACWLCERQLGKRIEWHHPVPKSRGGRLTVALHPICHRMIHVAFSNAELARMGSDAEAMRGSASLAKFLKWIENKPPDFHVRTRRTR